jgi:hypothetical protein
MPVRRARCCFLRPLQVAYTGAPRATRIALPREGLPPPILCQLAWRTPLGVNLRHQGIVRTSPLIPELPRHARSRASDSRHKRAFVRLQNQRHRRISMGGAAYGEIFKRRLRAMGIRDRPTAPRSPWQNGHAERLIGSIRRECLDHVVVFGERYLRNVLHSYREYGNGARAHLALNKDAPASRAIQPVGRILPTPILGGLHHPCVRM